MWTIFKVFIELVNNIASVLCFRFWPRGMWDLSSPTRNRTHTPCIGRQSLNHWAARKTCYFLFCTYHKPTLLSAFTCILSINCHNNIFKVGNPIPILQIEKQQQQKTKLVSDSAGSSVNNFGPRGGIESIIQVKDTDSRIKLSSNLDLLILGELFILLSGPQLCCL